MSAYTSVQMIYIGNSVSAAFNFVVDLLIPPAHLQQARQPLMVKHQPLD